MLFSSYYMGNIPYFQALAKYKEVKIDIHERYKKQTWRNRTQILESNGPLYLSVPVYRPEGNKSLVKDVEIHNAENWQKDHWKAIESSYQHSPYFFYYGEQIKQLIYAKEKLLYRYNLHFLKKFIEWLDIDTEVKVTNHYFPPKDKTDHRVSLDTKISTKEQVPYIQVFADKYGFVPNLSILDLLMNEGPLAHRYIFA